MEPEKLTVEELQQVRPDLYEQIFEAGKKAEQEKFEVLKEVCGGDFELLAESFAEGRSPEDALRLRVFKAEQNKDNLLAEYQKLGQKD